MSWATSWGSSWGAAWGQEPGPVTNPSEGRAWGNSWGAAWGNSWGGGEAVTPTYTIADVLVRAFRRGFFDGYLREVDATFYIDSPLEYSPYWMTFVDTPPDDWDDFLEVLSAEADRSIIRPSTETQAALWARTGEHS